MIELLFAAGLMVAQSVSPATAAVAPQLRNAEDVITYSDYPEEALRLREYGITSIVLQVTAQGSISACAVTESSGSPTLDRKTCAVYVKRARFTPATDATGQPIAAEFRAGTSWGVEDHQPSTLMSVPLLVKTLPPEYRDPVKARLLFDASGRVARCDVTTTSGSGAADRAACTYIRTILTVTPPKAATSDVAPVAVRYLTASYLVQPGETTAPR